MFYLQIEVLMVKKPNLMRQLLIESISINLDYIFRRWDNSPRTIRSRDNSPPRFHLFLNSIWVTDDKFTDW